MKLTIYAFLAVAISSFLAYLRIDGFKGQAFQAVAHLWVGFLIGIVFKLRGKPMFCYYTFCIVAISLVELIVFLKD